MFEPQEEIKDEKKINEPEETISAAEEVNAAIDSALTQKCEEYKLGWQRALADYQNLQKETSARRSEWAQISKLQILEDFIPVYDNFKKAFAMKPVYNSAGGSGDSQSSSAPLGAMADKQENWAMGIQFIMKQFGDVLKNHQIEEIKTVGEQFDPSKHEAVGEEIADGKKAGEIVREMDGGYVLGGKVVKVAKVIIAK
jgi:molecular chaperone GrpE